MKKVFLTLCLLFAGAISCFALDIVATRVNRSGSLKWELGYVDRAYNGTKCTDYYIYFSSKSGKGYKLDGVYKAEAVFDIQNDDEKFAYYMKAFNTIADYNLSESDWNMYELGTNDWGVGSITGLYLNPGSFDERGVRITTAHDPYEND